MDNFYVMFGFWKVLIKEKKKIHIWFHYKKYKTKSNLLKFIENYIF